MNNNNENKVQYFNLWNDKPKRDYKELRRRARKAQSAQHGLTGTSTSTRSEVFDMNKGKRKVKRKTCNSNGTRYTMDRVRFNSNLVVDERIIDHRKK